MKVTEDRYIVPSRMRELTQKRGAAAKCGQEANIRPATLTMLRYEDYPKRYRGVSLRTAGRIADYFDVSLDWLCGRSDVKEVQK